MINIDTKKCTRCGKCAEVCPALVIEVADDGAVAVNKNSCIKCYHCVAICPETAVTCEEFPIGKFKELKEQEKAPVAYIEKMLMGRRSVREFKNKPVSREMLEKLIEIGAHAPTGHNSQAVEFSVVMDRELINSLDTRILKKFNKLISIAGSPLGEAVVKMFAGKKKAEELAFASADIKRFLNSEGHGKLHIFRGAPVLIIAHSGADALTGKDDSVIAMSHIMFAAEAHGLGATWIGYLVGAARIDPALKKPLGVPSANTIQSAMILGWPKYSYKRIIPRKPAKVNWVG